MSTTLPPPAAFSHRETLHRIELPPLARFLHSLSVPAQLIKLNDILDRYRTPSSHHRVDIREIQSSELPPGDGEVDGETGTGIGEAGEPIELDEDTPLGEYKATTAVEAAPIPDAPSPEATHPLPPTGPRRRVRELRLDLRTLDAAALFALEQWRRQVLQLEDLPFDHPDSIWYQDEPEPEPVVKKPMGRPRKQTKSASVQVEVELDGVPAETQEQGDGTIQANGPGETEAVNGVEAFDAMVDTIVDNLESISGSEAPQDHEGPRDPAGDDILVQDPSASLTSQIDRQDQRRSPTPDQLLPDGFDVDAEDDSDYAPAPSPRPRARRKPDDSVNPSVPVPRQTTSGFTRAPSPVPMMAASTGRTKSPSRDTFSPEKSYGAVFSVRRASLTPSKRSASPQKRSRIGTSSDQPIELSASPDQPPRVLEPQSGFVPFVREQMRIPDSVVNGRSKPAWLVDDDATDRSDVYDTASNRRGQSVKKRSSKGQSKRVRLNENSEDDDFSIVDHQDVPPRRAEPTEEDEWADFRF